MPGIGHFMSCVIDDGIDALTIQQTEEGVDAQGQKIIRRTVIPGREYDYAYLHSKKWKYHGISSFLPTAGFAIVAGLYYPQEGDRKKETLGMAGILLGSFELAMVGLSAIWWRWRRPEPQPALELGANRV